MRPVKNLGFKGTNEKILQLWAKNSRNWKNIVSPWRPSVGDIDAYRQLGGDKFFGKVLILGSTPEIRDLVSFYNRQPVLVDISFNMLISMSRLLKEADYRNEVWLKSDWCEAPFPEEYFDLIIGDMIWWVVSVDYQEKLKDRIAALLKQDGLFVSRFRLRDIGMRSGDGFEIINKYFDRFTSKLDSNRKIIEAMLSRIYDITADTRERRIDLVKTKQFFEDLLESNHNSGKEAFIKTALQGLVGAEFTSQTRNEIVTMLGRKFELIGKKNATDYESHSYPVFSFKKIS